MQETSQNLSGLPHFKPHFEGDGTIDGTSPAANGQRTTCTQTGAGTLIALPLSLRRPVSPSMR